MKVELEAKNIIIDGIDVFDHIGKVEKEARELVQKVNKAIEWGKYNLDRYQWQQLERILKDGEEK